MRLLFVKQRLAWPRSSGHDVHAFHMMKACAALGHEVSLATVETPVAEAVAGLQLTGTYSLAAVADVDVPASWLQRRFRRFYGVPTGRLSAVADAARSARADAVILVGLDVLPLLPALTGVRRVWYAADEWVLHHVSQLRPGDSLNRENLRDAAVKGLYERAHRHVVDRVWVVSAAEQRAMRWLAGMRHVDVIPNGVDADYFHPCTITPEPDTAVFWGRLDFGPNIQALQWFCGRVWPLVRRDAPGARFTIVGFHPGDAVMQLAQVPGVTLVPDLPDLRSTVVRHAVAVLPFVSGGGIKNKLLEAAALGMPIICTPAATKGLRCVDRAPLITTADARDMAGALVTLWRNAEHPRELAAAARAWVIEHHTWAASAREALATLA